MNPLVTAYMTVQFQCSARTAVWPGRHSRTNGRGADLRPPLRVPAVVKRLASHVQCPDAALLGQDAALGVQVPAVGQDGRATRDAAAAREHPAAVLAPVESA